MPVDHPDKPLERQQQRPVSHGRKINAVLGFLIVLVLLAVLVPLLDVSGFMS